jgi:hypothetical protein
MLPDQASQHAKIIFLGVETESAQLEFVDELLFVIGHRPPASQRTDLNPRRDFPAIGSQKFYFAT